MSVSSPANLTLTALVVDDDPIFRSLVEARLTQFGCKILQAADGGEAWQLTRMHAFEVAIVDFEMPGLDGIALIRCLRNHPKTQHIPIVMCTSRTDAAAMQAAIEAGASSFLNKPITWSIFERHIQHLLLSSRKEAEIMAALEQSQAAHQQKDSYVASLLADLEKLALSPKQDGKLAAAQAADLHTRLFAFADAYAKARQVAEA